MIKSWKRRFNLWILGICAQVLHFASSTHFQGAAVSWRPGRTFLEEGKREILIDFRIAWRRATFSDSPTTFCDEKDVTDGKLLGHGEQEDYEWICKSGCSGTVAAAEVPCTQFDATDDWSVGFRTAAFNITTMDSFAIEFSGCCWIVSLVYASSSSTRWSLSIAGSVGIRSDTGKPNRSPISAVTPIIRFQAGCPDFVDLLVFDADQDDISCQFAECSQHTCTLYPYLKLTQNGDKCRLSYNAGGPGETNVAISIILEDTPRKENLRIDGTLQSTTTVLSSVPLQFIVRLHTEIHLCSLKPFWLDPTFSNGFVKTTVVGVEMKVEIRLLSTVILDVMNVIGPPGLTKEKVAEYKPDPLKNSVQYSTNLVFTATAEQVGNHMVCITARDTNGKMSEQRCMILKVGEGTPCNVDNGGCDDKCVPMGASSYMCECEQACWRLAEDRRTCIPDILIECLPDRFSIELPACAVGASTLLIGSQIGDFSPPCEADNNGTYYKKEVKYDECRTHNESDFSEIHYMSKLRMWVDDQATVAGSGDERLTITRGYYYNMHLVCSFNKYANVNATFRPKDREEGRVQVPGLGSFQFFFDFYVDGNFGAAYSPYEYPITVTVNSDLFFAIRTVGGSGLEVFTEGCVAMTTPTPTDKTISYTMIENGCFNDNTIKRYQSTNVMEDRYSIKAFRFQDNLNADNSLNIYIQCSAVLCIVGDPTTRCRRGCITTRKRRGSSDEIFIDSAARQRRSVDDEDAAGPTFTPNVTESNLLEITVSGPFRIEVEQTEGTPLVTVVTPTHSVIRTETTTKATKEMKTESLKESDSLTVVIIASTVGAVVFLLLIFAIIALICYYYIVLKPRHVILPDKEDLPRRSVSAWEKTTQNRKLSCETPPPPFEEIHPFT